MHKSIFLKYFTMFTSLFIICIFVMGVVFISLAFNQVMKSEHTSLLKSLDRSCEELIYNYDYDYEEINFLNMSRFFYNITVSSDHIIFVTDVDGNTIYCTLSDNCNNVHTKIESEILNDIINKGDYTEFGELSGIFSKRVFNAGRPIYLDDGTLIGFIFAGSQEYFNNDTLLYDIVRSFAYCSFFALLITFVAVYFITRRLVEPLREMSDAAKRFAVGDFSQKISFISVDEIGQLALAMNNMASDLEVAETAHKSFVANVSHELRTPMTSISGFVDGILDGTIPKEKETHYLNIVSDEIKRLSRLVRTMLNLSRIENNELVLNTARINIVDIICETLFSFEREIERKQIKLEGIENAKVFVMVDYDLIHQVLYNLIENAVKFVDDGGYIRFTFIEESEFTTIGVENSGRGLSKEEIPKIFDRFYKTDSSRGIDKNGVGLGLHIVRSIINLHGGDVMVQSVYGKYCKFSFKLMNYKQGNEFDSDDTKMYKNPLIL